MPPGVKSPPYYAPTWSATAWEGILGNAIDRCTTLYVTCTTGRECDRHGTQLVNNRLMNVMTTSYSIDPHYMLELLSFMKYMYCIANGRYVAGTNSR